MLGSRRALVVLACALVLGCAATSNGPSTVALEQEPNGWQPPPSPEPPPPKPEPIPPEEPEPPPPPPPPPPTPESDAPPVASTNAAKQKVELQLVMAQAVYTPEPDKKLLANTKAARFDKQDGDAIIGFCVDTNGKTADVRVIQPFPDDPMVDDILVRTIQKWRFMPFQVDGQKTKTCTQRTFKLRFN